MPLAKGARRGVSILALSVIGSLIASIGFMLALGVAPLAATSPVCSTLGLFGIASLVALYFGVNACGPWLSTPLVAMLAPGNHRHFGGSIAVLRHAGLLALWCCAISGYALLVFECLRAGGQVGIKALFTLYNPEVASRFDSVRDVPGGRAMTVAVLSTVLCTSTRRAEMINAIARGEPLQHPDGTEYYDADAKLNAAINRLPYARFAVGFLVPIYRELRRKYVLMEMAAARLIHREFTYEQLMTSADKLTRDQQYGRLPAMSQLSAELGATSYPDLDKEQQVKKTTIISALLITFGYNGACEMIVANSAQLSRRRSQRKDNSVLSDLLCVCATHGNVVTKIENYCVDGSGLRLVVKQCRCLEPKRPAPIISDGRTVEARCVYAEPVGADLRVGLSFSQMDTEVVRASLRRGGAAV